MKREVVAKYARIARKCPKCTSWAILAMPYNTATNILWEPFTDAKGRSHFHDTNNYDRPYQCRACKHEWVEGIKPACWCGWPDKIEE